MIVHSIALDFFRNYVHLDARFSPEVNVIYGENAQGKTNLLEAGIWKPRMGFCFTGQRL